MSCLISAYFDLRTSQHLGLAMREGCKGRKERVADLVFSSREAALWFVGDACLSDVCLFAGYIIFNQGLLLMAGKHRQTWVSSLPPRSAVPEQKANSLVFRLHPPGLCSEEPPDSPHHWLFPWKAEVSSTLFMDWKLLARWASKVQTLTQRNYIPSLRAANQKKQFAWIWIWF